MREIDAPNTDMADTRAMPTMRADAVCAVRRGLRIEFSRPSRPGIPVRRATGRPIALASGRAKPGATMEVPTKMPSAPRPTRATTGTDEPDGEQDCAGAEDGSASGRAAPGGDLGYRPGGP